MFKKTLMFVSSTILGVALSGMANAEFVYADWESEGDRLAVVNTDTGNAWLNLGVTKPYTMSQVVAELNGGRFDAWRLPTEQEIKELFMSLYPDLDPNGLYRNFHYPKYEIRPSMTNHLMFGESTPSYTYGVYYNQDGQSMLFGLRDSGGLYYNGFNRDKNGSYDGVYLVSDLSAVSNIQVSASDVSSPLMGGGAFMIASLFGLRRQLKKSAKKIFN